MVSSFTLGEKKHSFVCWRRRYFRFPLCDYVCFLFRNGRLSLASCLSENAVASLLFQFLLAFHRILFLLLWVKEIFLKRLTVSFFFIVNPLSWAGLMSSGSSRAQACKPAFDAFQFDLLQQYSWITRFIGMEKRGFRRLLYVFWVPNLLFCFVFPYALLIFPSIFSTFPKLSNSCWVCLCRNDCTFCSLLCTI